MLRIFKAQFKSDFTDWFAELKQSFFGHVNQLEWNIFPGSFISQSDRYQRSLRPSAAIHSKCYFWNFCQWLLQYKLNGRNAPEKAFGAFLVNFDTIYHLTDNKPSPWTETKPGEPFTVWWLWSIMKTKNNENYDWCYLRRWICTWNNHWLIANRKANFNW